MLLNEGEDGWREIVAQLPKGHPDKADLTKINEFLKDHAWASKGPVVLNPFNIPHTRIAPAIYFCLLTK